MKILYVSVHQILEFDEINIFQDLGHFVFPLGVYFEGKRHQPFRPEIEFTPELTVYISAFEKLGGIYKYGAAAGDQVIPQEFVAMFDAVIVMHDIDFIDQHWHALSITNVIWRSIGVGTQQLEPRVKTLRDRGVRIIRYSPTEQLADGYAGHDAIIRFGKRAPDVVWTGNQQQVVTFSHHFLQRYPQEYAFYLKATEGLACVLGGDGNIGLPAAAGVVDFDTQCKLLADSSLYFYASGSFIPYTLNFMEAWLSGIPLVAVDCRAIYTPAQCKFADVPNLIVSGVNGFLVSTPELASSIFKTLMMDSDMAKEIGKRGAADAKSHFSAGIIAPQWQNFFDSIKPLTN